MSPPCLPSCAAAVCATTAATAAANSFTQDTPRSAPTLLLAPGSAAAVSVKRGWAYTRCAAGQVPSAAKPCEPGVVASDDVDGPSIQDRVCTAMYQCMVKCMAVLDGGGEEGLTYSCVLQLRAAH